MIKDKQKCPHLYLVEYSYSEGLGYSIVNTFTEKAAIKIVKSFEGIAKEGLKIISTKKIDVEDIDKCCNINTIIASGIIKVKGEKGDKGDKGDPGDPGIPVKVKEINITQNTSSILSGYVPTTFTIISDDESEVSKTANLTVPKVVNDYIRLNSSSAPTLGCLKTYISEHGPLPTYVAVAKKDGNYFYSEWVYCANVSKVVIERESYSYSGPSTECLNLDSLSSVDGGTLYPPDSAAILYTINYPNFGRYTFCRFKSSYPALIKLYW